MEYNEDLMLLDWACSGSHSHALLNSLCVDKTDQKASIKALE